MNIDIFGHLPDCNAIIPPNVKGSCFAHFCKAIRCLNIYFRRILLYASIHTIQRNYIAG